MDPGPVIHPQQRVEGRITVARKIIRPGTNDKAKAGSHNDPKLGSKAPFYIDRSLAQVNGIMDRKWENM
jgi:hypothetical protein